LALVFHTFLTEIRASRSVVSMAHDIEGTEASGNMAAIGFDSNVVEARDYSRLDATIYNRARLSEMKVMVVGAGALGNEVIKNLTLLGLGTIYIVDCDVIESSNLTRSVLFCVPHVQQLISSRTSKAEFAASRVHEMNPEVRAIAIEKEIADVGLGVLARMNLIFSCLDNEFARLELSWACHRVNVPLVDAGLGTTNYSSGLVSLFPGSHGPCYACRKGRQRRREILRELHGNEDPCWAKERRLEGQGVISTTPLMASVIGAIQVEMGLRHILSPQDSSPEGKSIRVMLAPEAAMECFSFGISPECSLHEETVGEITKLSGHCSKTISVAELISSARDREEPEEAGTLCLDWPLVAEAACRHCGRKWQPMMRKARFQKAGSCPFCKSSDVSEQQVLTAIDVSAPWASMTLAQLGLPSRHIHEVYWEGTAPSRKYVELAGDWQ
jgi:adenylyltransferase/sulfurtransferase